MPYRSCTHKAGSAGPPTPPLNYVLKDRGSGNSSCFSSQNLEYSHKNSLSTTLGLECGIESGDFHCETCVVHERQLGSSLANRLLCVHTQEPG